QIFGKLRMHLEEYLLSKCSLATTGIRPNAFNFPATPTFILEPKKGKTQKVYKLEVGLLTN
ncbi:MAG: hypothetical protein WAO24_01650, partial [Peptococcia bacterium]